MNILVQDYLKNATITNTAQIVTESGHPIINIQDSRLSRAAWILPSALQGQLYGISMYGENPYLDLYATGDIYIDFDLRAQQSFDTFGLAGNNFGIVNLTLSWADTDINVPDGSVSYTYSEPQYTIVIPTGAVSARYFRITIGNVLPTGNYVTIGRVSLGSSIALPDVRTVFDLDYISTANRAFSDTMQLYGGPKVIYRRLSVSFPNIDDTEEIVSAFKAVDLYNPFFLTWDEECSDTHENMYCTLAENALPINHNEARFYTSRLSFQEVF